MARVLFIVGSRRKGNCYHLMKKLSDSLTKERISTDTIVPGNQKIYLCTGCMDCDKNGVCDFNDDMEENIKRVRESEVYSTKELKGKKIIAIAVGSKKHDEYSTDGALTSIGSFIEGAEAKLIYKNEFDRCLDFTDILNQEEKVYKVAQDIIKVIN